jgi:NifU-like protein involved in Fe-S cluster formation
MGAYSETLMDHFFSPRNSGALDAPDATGRAGAPGQGPFLILYLRIAGGRVADARYQTFGCGPTIASGSVLTELIIGRSLAECGELDVADVVDALDGVPPDKLHGPALAIAALRDAVRATASRDVPDQA